MLKTQYDVVIIGAGPSGLASAIAIASKSQLSVLVLDQRDKDHQRVGENIPPETLILLQKLGLESQFYQDGHEVCPGFASVWGSDSVGYNDFIVNPYGQSWRLNRHAFDMSLLNRACELGVEVVWQRRFVSAKKVMLDNQCGYQIHLQAQPLSQAEPQSDTANICLVEANFVVDASGSGASFAKSQKVKKQVDDKLIAIVRFAKLKHAYKGKQVRIEANSNSWCYHALLPEQKVVSMLVAERGDRQALESDAYHGFKVQLANTLWVSDQLNKLALLDEEYHTYLVTSGMLEQVGGEHWIAVGDAAASFDPISAQGIYKGLQHGLLAAKVVLATLEEVSAKQGQQMIDYADIVQRGYREYIQNRQRVYQKEKRWPSNDFWLNRNPVSSQHERG